MPAALPRLDRVIGDWFDHGLIRLTMAGVIAQLQHRHRPRRRRVQPRRARRYLDSSASAIAPTSACPARPPACCPPATLWTSLTKAQIAFGQGVSVNALQMATAVNTLANGGVLITPSLVRGSATTAGGNEVGTESRPAPGRSASTPPGRPRR